MKGSLTFIVGSTEMKKRFLEDVKKMKRDGKTEVEIAEHYRLSVSDFRGVRDMIRHQLREKTSK